MNTNKKLKLQYETKFQLFKAEALSQLESLETQVKYLEEVSGL